MKLVYRCEAHATISSFDTETMAIESKQNDLIPGLAMPACLMFTWIANARNDKNPANWPKVPNPECNFVLAREIP